MESDSPQQHPAEQPSKPPEQSYRQHGFQLPSPPHSPRPEQPQGPPASQIPAEQQVQLPSPSNRFESGQRPDALGPSQSPARSAVLPRSQVPTAGAQPQSVALAAAEEQSCAVREEPEALPPEPPAPQAQQSVPALEVSRQLLGPSMQPEQPLLAGRAEQPLAEDSPPPQPLPCASKSRASRRPASRPATSRSSVFAHCCPSGSASHRSRGYRAANKRAHARLHRLRANSNGSSFRLRQPLSKYPGFLGS